MAAATKEHLHRFYFDTQQLFILHLCFLYHAISFGTGFQVFILLSSHSHHQVHTPSNQSIATAKQSGKLSFRTLAQTDHESKYGSLRQVAAKQPRIFTLVLCGYAKRYYHSERYKEFKDRRIAIEEKPPRGLAIFDFSLSELSV